MKYYIHYIISIAITLSFLAATSSCEHKDLCYHHPHTVKIIVKFDWSKAPEADPAGMCVFFYPENGGEPRRFDFKGLEGGEIELNVGRYKVLCHNNDTEGVLYRNKNIFDIYSGYTREGDILESIYGSGYYNSKTPRVRGAEDERVVICPDMMWGGTATDVDITDDGLSYTCVPEWDKDKPVVETNKEYIITLYPEELTCIYTYEILNVKNLKHATQMCASLSGMSGGIYFSTQELYDERVTLPLMSTFDKVSTITGRFITFGHHEDNPKPHRMLLYVWMDDGEKYYFGSDSERFDVTNQIHNAPNKRRVHIVIDGLDLPQPIENGHGFKPSVDDWEEVHEYIIM